MAGRGPSAQIRRAAFHQYYRDALGDRPQAFVEATPVGHTFDVCQRDIRRRVVGEELEDVDHPDLRRVP